jgi:hypothetical protein
MPTKSASSITRAEAMIKPGKKLPAKAIYNLIQIIALPDSSPLSTEQIFNDTNLSYKLFTFNGKRLIEENSETLKTLSIDPFVNLVISKDSINIASNL